MSNDALNMDINQQLVLVTGGARGLGEEITKSVLAHGGSVIINYYRSRERAQAIADAHPGKAWAIQADVTDRASVDGLSPRRNDRRGVRSPAWSITLLWISRSTAMPVRRPKTSNSNDSTNSSAVPWEVP